MSTLADRLVVAPEVAEAIAAGGSVVALESTLISHGLPYPDNVDVARASQAAVRAAGAVPATVAIRDGRVLVGLSNADLEALGSAESGSIAKAARPTLAAALAAPGWAATTVSATMMAAHAAGIAVFATGGIGGVHRGALAGTFDKSTDRPRPPTLDISSDLEELARTPTIVVCAGPKAILDVPATVEYLETRGVPVIAVGQADVPGFFARSSGVRAPISAPDLAAAARLAAIHLGLAVGGGVLICVPVPEPNALAPRTTREAVARAVVEADAQGIAGPALTPWLLARVATLTEGASVRANRALIINNAAAAGHIARLLAGG
jgi:pseudouridine-5'-phosphate glycosidase